LQTLTLGCATIDRVTELERWAFPPDALFPDISRGLLESARGQLGDQFIDPATGELILSIHTYLIRTPTTTILVDSGNGNHKQRPAMLAHHMFNTDYLARLASAGVQREDVDFVVCTHLHPDHCGGNTVLSDGQWIPTYPRASYVFARTEFDSRKAACHAPAANGVEADIAATFADSVAPVAASDQARTVDTPHVLLEEAGVRVTIRDAPGHTPGHVMVAVESDSGPDAVITGDVIHHPFQFAALDLPQAGDHDRALAAATRRKLCETCADSDIIVLTAHFAGPGAGRITRCGEGYRFAWLDASSSSHF
jgi:glyoxylase-like metal-dependent hydrolase (beta-lactamase superfamily II)